MRAHQRRAQDHHRGQQRRHRARHRHRHRARRHHDTADERRRVKTTRLCRLCRATRDATRRDLHAVARSRIRIRSHRHSAPHPYSSPSIPHHRAHRALHVRTFGTLSILYPLYPQSTYAWSHVRDPHTCMYTVYPYIHPPPLFAVGADAATRRRATRTTTTTTTTTTTSEEDTTVAICALSTTPRRRATATTTAAAARAPTSPSKWATRSRRKRRAAC